VVWLAGVAFVVVGRCIKRHRGVLYFYKTVKENNVIPFGPLLSLAGMVIFILQMLHFTF